jgi:hypothetical protein
MSEIGRELPSLFCLDVTQTPGIQTILLASQLRTFVNVSRSRLDAAALKTRDSEKWDKAAIPATRDERRLSVRADVPKGINSVAG